MNSIKVHLLLMVLVMLVGFAMGDLCLKGGKMMGGNYYCQAVQAVHYKNVGHTGSYNDTIGMASDGTCSVKTKHFKGHLAPFDEELTLHVRGPAAIKQVAVYLPGSDNTVIERAHSHGHRHSHAKDTRNLHRHELAKKDQVIATIDGQVVSWENNWFGPSADSSPTTLIAAKKKVAEGVATTDVTLTRTVTTTTCIVSQVTGHDASKTATANPTSAITTSTTPSVTDVQNDAHEDLRHKLSYKRFSYYEASSQTVENLAFLGNYGGQGSGVWDRIWGNSLSYIDCNASLGAANHQILADTLIPSFKQVTIATGKKCDNGDCGFVRPGGVAYHGFGGDDKVFLIEVGMPSDGQTVGDEADQPAVWLLNAKIPRIRQYGNCTCWPNCGELDIAEALSIGSHYMKSTVHAEASGGDSDYFQRPMQGTFTILTVLRKDEIFIGIVRNLKFPKTLSSEQLDDWMGGDATTISDFTIT